MSPGFANEQYGGPAPELEQLIATVRIGAESDRRIADQLATAAQRFRRPLRIQVTGRAGAGKSTLLRALALMSAEETTPVDQPGVSDPVLDADLVVYVLAGSLQAADRRVLESLRPDNTLVVLNKADAVGSRWADAVAAADQAAHGLSMPVAPVVAELAVHTRAGTPSDDDLRTLRRHAAGNATALTLSPDLFVDAAAGPDVAERRAVLDRWGLHGVACALVALRHDPGLGPQQLLQLLHAATGIDPVHARLHQRYEQIAALRGGELLDELGRIAARAVPRGDGGRARDLIEDYLAGDEALRIALRAGLACPEVRHLAAGYPAVMPSDADDALVRAQRWRAVAAGEMPAGARRAAIRLHNGYIRMWERMSSAGL
ncbi:hypothetical protein HGA07_08770 [Nocardia veterana]|uniref:Uncharacterized protein n=2 Tax=Nocardia veterana TaxID=132249 RepID=A0A7X6RH72_9NOCA|nr:hypothetical protein [Nocardia veterana]